jgi:hypothetical protein
LRRRLGERLAKAGLILAAKSIARYPDFKRKQFAEYFLIGTVLRISAASVEEWSY